MVFFYTMVLFCFFFFSSRRRHTRCALVNWSSDVCSSDLSRVDGGLATGGVACEPAPDQRVHLAAHPPPPPPEAHAEPAQGRGDPSRLRHSRGEAPDQPPVVWPPGRGRAAKRHHHCDGRNSPGTGVAPAWRKTGPRG